MISRPKALRCAFWIFLAFYSFILVFKAHFGPIDDHVLIETLEKGKALPLFIMPDIGRFYPLDGQELNLLSKVSREASWFYFFNALELFGLFAILSSILAKAGLKKYLKLSFVILILSPGFVTAWFRLLVPERDALFYLAAFLWCYLSVLENPKKYLLLFFAALCANIALYYKEPMFLLMGAFATSHFVLAKINQHRTHKPFLLDILIIISALTFAAAYYIFAYRFRGAHLYGDTHIKFFWTAARNLASATMNDPYFIFFFIPLAIYRSICVIRTPWQAHPVFDSMWIASIVYAAAFLKLGIYAPYYLLPTYALMIPSATYFYSQKNAPRFLRGGWVAASLVFLLNAFPFSLHLITFYKYVPLNYDQVVNFLNDESREPAAKLHIYLDGVDPKEGVEVYSSLETFLKSESIDPKKIAFFSERPTDSDVPLKTPEPGDYLIITPYSAKHITAHYLEDLGKDYILKFHTPSPFAFPKINFKTLYLALSHGGTNALTTSNQNIFEWPDYYVFERKD